MSLPMIWLVVAVLCGLFEATTVSLFSLWFMIGAIVAFCVSFFTENAVVQTLIFIAVSVISLIAIRPFAKKCVDKITKHDNINTKVGHSGVVIEHINKGGKGRVRLGDVTWIAICKNGEIPSGQKVIVTEVDGNTLTVEPTEEGNK